MCLILGCLFASCASNQEVKKAILALDGAYFRVRIYGEANANDIYGVVKLKQMEKLAELLKHKNWFYRMTDSGNVPHLDTGNKAADATLFWDMIELTAKAQNGRKEQCWVTDLSVEEFEAVKNIISNSQ